MMDWFRWHHGSVSDPKFQLVAKRASATVAEVVAVWAFVLETASQSESRGQFDGIDCEAVDLALGMVDGTAQRILIAMEQRGLIEGGRIAAWSKRQPKREDESANERKRRQREREHAERIGKPECVTGSESRAVTQSHAESRAVTPEEKREEEKDQKQKQEQQQEPVAPRASLAEPATDPATGRPLTIPLNTGAEHPVTDDDLGEYRRLFPAVDLPRELLLARRWCLDNPTKRKTARGVRAFLTRWLERAQDRAPSRTLHAVPGGRHENHRPASAVERVHAAIARRRADRGEFPEFADHDARVVAEQ